ncbi:hypothetical protein EVAR_14871_1 [Eumeta japonica]|uniref:Uncharacterized protein n=1 Tax=Eumeta variegata TaxID=151549 RepID=A0A4C1V3S2_EUMVA|nr:hypothetical protein EVAR_14871_1 [Eumeta japonica]
MSRCANIVRILLLIRSSRPPAPTVPQVALTRAQAFVMIAVTLPRCSSAVRSPPGPIVYAGGAAGKSYIGVAGRRGKAQIAVYSWLIGCEGPAHARRRRAAKACGAIGRVIESTASNIHDCVETSRIKAAWISKSVLDWKPYRRDNYANFQHRFWTVCDVCRYLTPLNDYRQRQPHDGRAANIYVT